MLIEIKGDIFNDIDFRGLNFLLQIAFYKDRYQIFVDLAKISTSELYSRLDYDDRAILEQEFNKIIISSKESTIKYTISKEKKDAHFNIEEALRFFMQPVSILLENSRYDAYFMNAIIRCFDDTGEIQRHLDNGWLQYENAGGQSNIENFIKGKLESYNSLPQANKRYLRAFVLMDSDKTYKTMQFSSKLQNLTNFLQENHILSHVLEKREIENYMPMAVLEQKNEVYINTYIATFTPEQKDYFDLEKGLKKDRTDTSLDLNLLALYQSLSDEDWAIFKVGFKQTIARFKKEFPKLFEHETVTKESLLERTKDQAKPKELAYIIEKIRKLL